MKLLVAALESELVAFPEHLPGFERLVTGPGKLKATYALTRALDAGNYEEILVVGTAGALDETIEAGVHEIHWTFQHDVIDEKGVRGAHVSMPQRIQLGEGDISIATGDSFIDDADAVQLIRSLGGRLVDMESYVYAWVAAQFDVPIRIWKAVSDNAQDGANTTWEEAVTACSHQLRDRIRAQYGV
ncbi:phosphorylase family protein [Microbacterium sp.]|uniref:phosphorylase family protein n=1 Tax=Microbacterium sp. TaxID=51671 RepID=UPI003F9A68E3